jgi:hypothetical protein
MSWPRRWLLDIDCERLVFGMRAHGNGAVLAATDEELDELIGFVAAEANHELSGAASTAWTLCNALTEAALAEIDRDPTGIFWG